MIQHTYESKGECDERHDKSVCMLPRHRGPARGEGDTAVTWRALTPPVSSSRG
jgi:hypothetical protein